MLSIPPLIQLSHSVVNCVQVASTMKKNKVKGTLIAQTIAALYGDHNSQSEAQWWDQEVHKWTTLFRVSEICM